MKPDMLCVCWSCQGPVRDSSLFCHTCGAVQQPGTINHFARFGLPVDFDLDIDKLDKLFHGLQRNLHPDRFAGKTAREKLVAQNQAVTLNDAYQVLHDPLLRAIYILEMNGVGSSIKEDRTISDTDLLEEMMEYRENLANAENSHSVEALAVKAAAQAIDIVQKISLAFTERDWQKAEQLTVRFKYLRKFLRETKVRMVVMEEE